MALLSALGVLSADDLDPTRPLDVGGFTFGAEAAAEACRIAQGGDFAPECEILPHRFERPTYWAVHHNTNGNAEVFGFPGDDGSVWPTALEVAIVRALAASSEDYHSDILSGDHCICLGSAVVWADFRKIAILERRPLVGSSIISEQHGRATLRGDISEDLSNVALEFLANSFRTSPLKFRFLELYRMIEALFLADVKAKLLRRFDEEPSDALAEATDALKSEMTQLAGLASNWPEPFEASWETLSDLKNTNRFVAALFRRVEKKGHHTGGKAKLGAALIYQMRCAIVHAGEKDMIFEKYPDGDAAVMAVISDVEKIALTLVGIELS